MVLDLVLPENLDHLLDQEGSPGPPLPHLLMVHPVSNPQAQHHLVHLLHVVYVKRRRRVPVLGLALDVPAKGSSMVSFTQFGVNPEGRSYRRMVMVKYSNECRYTLLCPVSFCESSPPGSIYGGRRRSPPPYDRSGYNYLSASSLRRCWGI